MKMRHATLFAALFTVALCSISTAAEGEAPAINKDAKETMVYVTKSGEKYHCKDCRTIADNNATATTLTEAKKKLQPCAVCKPDAIVLISEKGEKYHTKECKVAGENTKEVEVAAAQTQGYQPCKICHPEATPGVKKDRMKDGEKPAPVKKKEGS
jgi:hypothetical protein